MKKLAVVFAAILFAGCFAQAAHQQQDWKGRVFDEKGEALPYANTILMSMPDSTVIAGTTTEEDGSFLIQSDARNARLMVAMIGYRTVWVDRGDCAEIHMEIDSETLGESRVTAVMPKTRLTDQGLLTSVRGSVLENVGTAKDALARVPGIIRNQDGLEVLGKGAPLIFINGRRVTDASELDRLQSNEIQSVEVISNPGAQYSAAVRAVVRIRTIKHQGDGFGFNSGITDEQSLRNSWNNPTAYINTNFRHNGLDIFAGANGVRYCSRQESNMLQETYGTPGFKQEGTLDFVQDMVNVGFNGGLNWQISDNHSTGFRIDTDMDPKISSNQIIKEDAFVGGELIDRLTSKGGQENDSMPANFKVNTYYNGTVGKLNIDFNADYYGIRSSQDAWTQEESEMAEDDLIKFISHSSSKMYAAKLVLSYPIWQGALQTGTEDVFTRRGDDYTITSAKVPSSGSEVKEDNIALFASYGFYIPKAGQFSAGVRYEHVNYEYDDLVGTDDLSRKYDNFFPTLSYANAFGPVQLQASYSAKTARPDFYSLSSAIRYHSRYILQSGNNKLQPQTSHNFNLTGNWKFLTMVAGYARINDAIAQWSELYNSEGIVLVHPINLDKPMRALEWYVNASPTVGVWTMNYTAGVMKQWLTLDCPDAREASGFRSISYNKPMWIAQLYNTFRLKGDWQLELGGEFHSKAHSQNTLLTNNYFNLNAGVQKSFLDGALVVRLSGNDLLGLANYDVMTDCGSHLIKQTNIMDTKRLVLSIRYNFNTAASKYKGTGAGKDTVSRMSGN